jgi:mannose-6-phosphate isomerase
MNELYPLKFKPIIKESIWGGKKLNTVLGKDIPSDKSGESWELSGVQKNLSVVSDGFLKGNDIQELTEVYMGDLVGDKVYKKFGIEFPLLIKFIDANDVLSIQVHPDDKVAKERHNAYGKTEMWYVLENKPDAELICGFKKDITKDEYLNNLKNNTLKDILNSEKVAPGDCFFIPAGRVHAIGAGILLAEIQQTSDITYRIYDFDRRDAAGNARELHTDLAVDVIDYKAHSEYKTEYTSEQNKATKLVDCQYFTTNTLSFDSSIDCDFNLIDSFVIYIGIEGCFDIEYRSGEKTRVNKGETVLVPAMLKEFTLTPQPSAKALEVYIR